MARLQEARIILPKLDDMTARNLVDTFGGYTAHAAEGAWRDDAGTIITEPMIVIDIAMPLTPQAETSLHTIAGAAGRRANQKAVYLRYASGRVEILSLAQEDEPIVHQHILPPNADHVNDKPPLDATPRLPQPGEIWERRDGGKVYVVRQKMNNHDMLTVRTLAADITTEYPVFLDGRYPTTSETHAADLVKHVYTI